MESQKCIPKGKYNKLKIENKALKETCEILADKEVMQDIQESLKQIREGKGISISFLKNV